MCIRYPFLYPRNRFTDKHRVNLLYRSINKLHNQSRQEIGITGIRYANNDISRRDSMIWTKDRKLSPK